MDSAGNRSNPLDYNLSQSVGAKSSNITLKEAVEYKSSGFFGRILMKMDHYVSGKGSINGNEISSLILKNANLQGKEKQDFQQALIDTKNHYKTLDQNKGLAQGQKGVLKSLFNQAMKLGGDDSPYTDFSHFNQEYKLSKNPSPVPEKQPELEKETNSADITHPKPRKEEYFEPKAFKENPLFKEPASSFKENPLFEANAPVESPIENAKPRENKEPTLSDKIKQDESGKIAGLTEAIKNVEDKMRNQNPGSASAKVWKERHEELTGLLNKTKENYKEIESLSKEISGHSSTLATYKQMEATSPNEFNRHTITRMTQELEEKENKLKGLITPDTPKELSNEDVNRRAVEINKKETQMVSDFNVLKDNLNLGKETPHLDKFLKEKQSDWNSNLFNVDLNNLQRQEKIAFMKEFQAYVKEEDAREIKLNHEATLIKETRERELIKASDDKLNAEISKNEKNILGYLNYLKNELSELDSEDLAQVKGLVDVNRLAGNEPSIDMINKNAKGEFLERFNEYNDTNRDLNNLKY